MDLELMHARHSMVGGAVRPLNLDQRRRPIVGYSLPVLGKEERVRFGQSSESLFDGILRYLGLHFSCSCMWDTARHFLVK